MNSSRKGLIAGLRDHVVRPASTGLAGIGARAGGILDLLCRLASVTEAALVTALLLGQETPSPAAAAGPDPWATDVLQALLSAADPATRSERLEALQAQLTPQTATALRREAKRRSQLGDLAGAQAAADAAVAVGAQLDNASAQGEGHLAWGIVLTRQGDHVAARARYDEALRLATSAKDAALELEARTLLGRSSLHAGDFDEAGAEFRRCLELAMAIPDQAAEARALHNLGETMRQRGQLQDALTHFEHAIAREPGGTNVAATADTRLNLAGVLLELGEPEDAVREYEAVLAHYRKVQDLEGVGIVLGNLGVACEMTARYDLAMRHYEQSLAIRLEVRDLPGQVVALNNLGVLWLMAGDHEAALDYFQQSLGLAEQTADFSGRARALNNRGETLAQMGRFLEAFRALDESLQLYRDAGDQVSAAEVRGGMGALKKALGDYRGALADFREILPVFEADGRKPLVAITLHNLGGMLQLLGRSREAAELLTASLMLRQELGDRQGEAVTQNALGEVALLTGDPEAAHAHYLEALAIARDIRAPIEEVRALLGLGQVEMHLGRPPEALRRFREAEDASAPLSDVGLRIGVSQRLGDAHRVERDWDEAVAAYQRAVARIEALRTEVSGASYRVSFLEQHAPAYHGLATCQVRLGQVTEAWRTAEACQARALAEALNAGRTARPENLTGDEQQQWHDLERQVRLARLEHATVESQAPVEPARLKEVAGRLGPAIQALETFEKELQLRHPASASMRALAADLTGPGFNTLGQDESVVFLEYLVGEESTLLFVLDPPSQEPERGLAVRSKHRGDVAADSKSALQASGFPAAGEDRQEEANALGRGNLSSGGPESGAPPLAVFELKVTSSDLTKLVRNLRNRLENQWLSLPLPESRRLYDLLIAPVGEHLAGRSLVCIVPDGVLWEVPFQALCDSSERYLIQQLAVAYAPSLRALGALRERQGQRDRGVAEEEAQNWNLLVMANPDLGRVTEVTNPLLGPPVAIPGTEEQGRRIAAMFGERSRLCVGVDATEQRARELAPQYRALHFATHGIFEPGSPMFSGIRLAREAEHDGYWEAREILLTGLDAELVVLSACETARGQLRKGEGIWGLSWALLSAGSRANVLSQWAVADQSTAELMTAFYRHWRGAAGEESAGAGGAVRATKAEALRRAQIELLEGRSAGGCKHAHPFHWAPFILIGDWR